MTPQLTSREAVLRAVREYDQLGQDRFLEAYGFGRSRTYVLRIDGRDYDSKAIVGVAFGYEHPERGVLRSDEFSGGAGGAGAAAQLVRLGFEVVGDRGTVVERAAPVAAQREARRTETSPPPRSAVSLPAPDLERTLIVLPCSGAKRRAGRAKGHERTITTEIDPALAQELQAARQRLAEMESFDERNPVPALGRYDGALYQVADDALTRAVATGGHVVIVSGGYGVLLGEEPIGLYDRRFVPGDWPRKLAGRVLSSYAERHDIKTVVAFLARTTSYADVVRTAPWPSNVEQVELVSAAHAGGGGMRIVPQVLGEAADAYLQGRLDGEWRSSRGVALTTERLRSSARSSSVIDVEEAVEQLLRSERHHPTDFEKDRQLADEAGLYAWFGDKDARALVEQSLGDAVDDLLYIGQAGATKWPSGTRSKATLGSRIRTQHIGGNTRSSTLRRTLAAALGPGLGLRVNRGRLDRASEERLRQFIRDHLRVAVLSIADRDQVCDIEAAVVKALDPPLNLDHVALTEPRQRLRALRAEMRGEG